MLLSLPPQHQAYLAFCQGDSGLHMASDARDSSGYVHAGQFAAKEHFCTRWRHSGLVEAKKCPLHVTDGEIFDQEFLQVD